MRRTGKRTLQAESLESRQLLHGGGMGEPPTTEARVESAFERYDTNEDMQISEDEVSDRLWSRISAADGDDEDATVSVAELTSYLDAQAAEDGGGEGERRDRGRGRSRRAGRGDRGPDGRGDRVRTSFEERLDALFAENDTNEDGVITADDDVSEDLLERLAEADVDGDGVSREDLIAHREARQQARFDARFARADDNGDGGITEEEAGRRWERISAADADGDGSVTSTELQEYIEAQRAEREAEMNEEGTTDEE